LTGAPATRPSQEAQEPAICMPNGRGRCTKHVADAGVGPRLCHCTRHSDFASGPASVITGGKVEHLAKDRGGTRSGWPSNVLSPAPCRALSTSSGGDRSKRRGGYRTVLPPPAPESHARCIALAVVLRRQDRGPRASRRTAQTVAGVNCRTDSRVKKTRPADTTRPSPVSVAYRCSTTADWRPDHAKPGAAPYSGGGWRASWGMPELAHSWVVGRAAGKEIARVVGLAGTGRSAGAVKPRRGLEAQGTHILTHAGQSPLVRRRPTTAAIATTPHPQESTGASGRGFREDAVRELVMACSLCS